MSNVITKTTKWSHLCDMLAKGYSYKVSAMLTIGILSLSLSCVLDLDIIIKFVCLFNL